MLPSHMITIGEKMFHKLSALKKETQSFSDLIEELLLKTEQQQPKHLGKGTEPNSGGLDNFERYLMEHRRFAKQPIRLPL